MRNKEIITKGERKFITVQETLKLWNKYLKGKNNFQLGSNLPNHSIMAQIQRMVEGDFVFRTFNKAGNEMSAKEDFKDHLSSNGYLINLIKEGYFATQSLYIRRLTENKHDPCSLMSLLLRIKDSKHNLNRELFYRFHDDDSCAKAAFDILSGNKENENKDDRINDFYVESLIDSLKTESIKIVKDYTDKVVAHSDFNIPDEYPTMDTIKSCHNSIIKVYKEIELNFFLVDSSFGDVNLCEEQILRNIEKPFYTKG